MRGQVGLQRLLNLLADVADFFSYLIPHFFDLVLVLQHNLLLGWWNVRLYTKDPALLVGRTLKMHSLLEMFSLAIDGICIR